MTSLVKWPFDTPYAISYSYWYSFGTKPLSLTVFEIFNVEFKGIIDITLIRPLNKGRGHSFWYQSITHIRYTTSYAVNSNFCSRTHRLATIRNSAGADLHRGPVIVQSSVCFTQQRYRGTV